MSDRLLPQIRNAIELRKDEIISGQGVQKRLSGGGGI